MTHSSPQFSSRRMNLITDLFYSLPALAESSCVDYSFIAGTGDGEICSWDIWHALLIERLDPIFSQIFVIRIKLCRLRYVLRFWET